MSYNKNDDEFDKWIRIWFTGYRRGIKYFPPLPVILFELAIIAIILLSKLEQIITKPIGMISFIVLLLALGNIIIIIRRMNIEEVTLSSIAIILSALSIIFNQYIQITILFSIISIVIVIVIQLEVNLRKRKNLCLKVIKIESADYEKEFIFFEEQSTKDIYFTDFDLGERLRVGDTYKVDVLQCHQYQKETITLQNKEVNAYYLMNIDKDRFFNKVLDME